MEIQSDLVDDHLTWLEATGVDVLSWQKGGENTGY